MERYTIRGENGQAYVNAGDIKAYAKAMNRFADYEEGNTITVVYCEDCKHRNICERTVVIEPRNENGGSFIGTLNYCQFGVKEYQ